MNPLLDEISLPSSEPVFRTLDNACRSGVIRDDAPHWSIEPFIPIHIAPLIEYLVGRNELNESNRKQFRQFCRGVDSIHRDRTNSYQRRFAAAYTSLDPDNDCRDPFAHRQHRNDDLADTTSRVEHDAAELSAAASPADTTIDQTAADQVIQLCREVLTLAGYQPLDRQQIEQCAGIASQFGVPLHVDFDLFERLEAFSRGDIMGTRMRRRLRRLYRREQVDVPIYQRVVVIFQLARDEQSGEYLSSSMLHLRMFKNIPKQDLDMLMPGTRVRIGGLDRAKFILPSLGGFLLSIRRIAQYAVLFAFIALTKSLLMILNVVIIAVLIVAYLAKSVMSYFQTKKHYQLNLTQNLYFQKLDCNAGVAYRLIRQAERQSLVEVIIAYYGILISAAPVSERKLRRRCERVVREAIDVEVEFQVERALTALHAQGFVVRGEDGWQVRPKDGGQAQVGK